MWHGEWSPSSSWKLCPAVALTSSNPLCCCCCWTYLAYFRFEIILPRTSSGELALICPDIMNIGPGKNWTFQQVLQPRIIFSVSEETRVDASRSELRTCSTCSARGTPFELARATPGRAPEAVSSSCCKPPGRGLQECLDGPDRGWRAGDTACGDTDFTCHMIR